MTSTHQKWKPVIGPRCQRADHRVARWRRGRRSRPRTTTQKPTRDARAAGAARGSRGRRRRSPRARARATHDIGPHQKSSGSARVRPRIRKQRTSPMFDGLKTCAAAPHDHVLREQRDRRGAGEDPPAAQAPPVAVRACPGTRRMNATPLPVSIALAGHMRTCCCRNAIPTSSTAHVASEMRICAIETPEVERRPGRSPAAT